MTNDEIKDNQEIVRIQQETLKNLEKYNADRKTKIIDDPEEDVLDVLTAFERGERGVTAPPMQEWLDAQDELNKQRGITVEESTEPDEKFIPEAEHEEKLIMSHICPYCGIMAYIGQMHGLGYCREKVQYEQ